MMRPWLLLLLIGSLSGIAGCEAKSSTTGGGGSVETDLGAAPTDTAMPPDLPEDGAGDQSAEPDSGSGSDTGSTDTGSGGSDPGSGSDGGDGGTDSGGIGDLIGDVGDAVPDGGGVVELRAASTTGGGEVGDSAGGKPSPIPEPSGALIGSLGVLIAASVIGQRTRTTANRRAPARSASAS